MQILCKIPVTKYKNGVNDYTRGLFANKGRQIIRNSIIENLHQTHIGEE
jgi:hypothetical protein